MHIELVDLLRCPQAHAETWLVGAFDRMRGRDVVEGVLGCPVCRAEYPIRYGAVRFDAPSAAVTNAQSPPARDPLVTAVSALADAAGLSPAAYLAALLDLADPGGVVLLEGGWGAFGHALAELCEVRLLLLDPHMDVEATELVCPIRAGGVIPLAASCLRAGALASPDPAAHAMLPGLVRALSPRGRLVAASALPVPLGVTELARDSACWVAERETTDSAPIALARAGRE